MPRLDPAAIMAAAIHQHVEDIFVDVPFKVRTKHVAKIEDRDRVTVWRWYKKGKLLQPCRDDIGPWWPRDPYKADVLKRMLAEQEVAHG